MTEPKKLPRQPLPNAPRAADGRPIGTRCTGTCHRANSTQCHCTVCHNLIATVTDFDRHRQDGYCLDLTSLGLVERDGLWATPERHANDERKAAILAAARTA